MEANKSNGKPCRWSYPWWTRAIIFAVVTAVAMSALFAGTGYPGEHWPLATGTMGVVLFIVKLAADMALLATTKGLRAYRNAVYSRNNLDPEAEQKKVASKPHLIMAVTLLLIAFNAALVWGAALLVLNLVLPVLELPALARSIHLVSICLFTSGLSCLTTVIVLACAGYFCIDRMSQNDKPAPVVFRLLFAFINTTAAARQRPSMENAILPVQTG